MSISRTLLPGIGALLLPLPALAQTPPAAPAPTQARWTLELVGGTGSGGVSKTGAADGQLPLGDTFITNTGLPSRFQSTWRLGDGAALFNQAAAQLEQLVGQPIATIVPLDDVVHAPGRRPASAVLGVRIGRAVSARWTVALSLERQTGGPTLDDRWTETIEAARASFQRAFSDVIDVAPATGRQVSSTATYPEQRQTHMRVIGEATRTLHASGRLAVLGTLGGGVQFAHGSAAEVLLKGRYAALPFNFGELIQTDDITIRFVDKNTVPIGVAGMGFQFDIARHTALRIDGRLQLTPNRSTTELSTAPTTNTGSSQPLVTRTNPSLQFSNLSGVRSTLDGGADTTVTTFRGSGISRQFLITVGLVLRL